MQGAQVQSLVRELDPTYHKKKKKKKKNSLKKNQLKMNYSFFLCLGDPSVLAVVATTPDHLTANFCITYFLYLSDLWRHLSPSFPKSKHPLTGEETESHNPDVTCLKLPDIPETALDFLGPWSRMWGGQGEVEQCCLYFESLRDLRLDERVRYLRYLTLGL